MATKKTTKMEDAARGDRLETIKNFVYQHAVRAAEDNKHLDAFGRLSDKAQRLLATAIKNSAAPPQ